MANAKLEEQYVNIYTHMGYNTHIGSNKEKTNIAIEILEKLIIL